MLLIDTCVFSELRKVPLGTADPSVVRWARGLDDTSGYMSAVTVKKLECLVARWAQEPWLSGHGRAPVRTLHPRAASAMLGPARPSRRAE